MNDKDIKIDANLDDDEEGTLPSDEDVDGGLT